MSLPYWFGQHWRMHVWNIVGGALTLVILTLVSWPSWIVVCLAAISGAGIYNSGLIVSLREDARRHHLDLDALDRPYVGDDEAA